MFNSNYIADISTELKYVSNRLSGIKGDFHSQKQAIDWKIRSRHGISYRLNRIDESLSDVDVQIKKLVNFIQQSIVYYNNCEQKVKSNSVQLESTLKEIHNMVLDGFSGDENPSMFKQYMTAIEGSVIGTTGILAKSVLESLNYKLIEKNGVTYLKLSSSISNYKELRKLFLKNIDASSPWRKESIRRIMESSKYGDGIVLYNENQPKSPIPNQDRKIFSETKVQALNGYVKRLPYNPARKVLSAAGTGAADSIKGNVMFWDDFRGWKDASNFTKIGKSAGALGNVLMIGSNWAKAHDENGNFDSSKFVVDTAVDVGSAAAATAAGAAAGSLFLPPLGTVIGAGAGFAVNMAFNAPLLGDKSVVDVTKDFANEMVDEASKAIDDVTDTIGNVTSNIGKKLDKVFW